MVDIDISALNLGTRISGKTSQNNLLKFKVNHESFYSAYSHCNLLIYSIFSLKKSIIVCDQRVEISLIEYFDKVFVVVTSSGRLGAIVVPLFLHITHNKCHISHLVLNRLTSSQRRSGTK